MQQIERDSPLQSCMKRRVGWLAQQDSPAADELFRLAAHPRRSWVPADWHSVLEGLDKCRLTVAEWLREREERK